MIWTMPRPVLQWVASLMALGAATAFVMGVINAPDRGGRLPGERASGRNAVAGTAINAADATPLSQERIEAPPKPAPKAINTDESDAADAADQPVNVIPPANAADAGKAAPVITPPAPAADAATQAPPPEEPPH